jgi:hypothetical protein
MPAQKRDFIAVTRLARGRYRHTVRKGRCHHTLWKGIKAPMSRREYRHTVVTARSQELSIII